MRKRYEKCRLYNLLFHAEDVYGPVLGLPDSRASSGFTRLSEQSSLPLPFDKMEFPWRHRELAFTHRKTFNRMKEHITSVLHHKPIKKKSDDFKDNSWRPSHLLYRFPCSSSSFWKSLLRFCVSFVSSCWCPQKEIIAYRQARPVCSYYCYYIKKMFVVWQPYPTPVTRK